MPGAASGHPLHAGDLHAAAELGARTRRSSSFFPDVDILLVDAKVDVRLAVINRARRLHRDRRHGALREGAHRVHPHAPAGAIRRRPPPPLAAIGIICCIAAICCATPLLQERMRHLLQTCAIAVRQELAESAAASEPSGSGTAPSTQAPAELGIMLGATAVATTGAPDHHPGHPPPSARASGPGHPAIAPRHRRAGGEERVEHGEQGGARLGISVTSVLEPSLALCAALSAFADQVTARPPSSPPAARPPPPSALPRRLPLAPPPAHRLPLGCGAAVAASRGVAAHAAWRDVRDHQTSSSVVIELSDAQLRRQLLRPTAPPPSPARAPPARSSCR